MQQGEWIRIGIVNGWASPPVCVTHDGVPTAEEEDEDACVHAMRLYESDEQRQAVEAFSPPAGWRKTGWDVT